MTRPERDALLEAVTEDVVEHVLYDSFLQAQIIAQEVERSAARMFAYEDLIELLEETGLLDRASENLPVTDEITERRRGGRRMERPSWRSWWPTPSGGSRGRWRRAASRTTGGWSATCARTSPTRWSSAPATCCTSTRCARS